MKRIEALKEVSGRRPERGRRHAIVIGGSMAGLLAARALTDYFDQVTIIERDQLTDEPAPRRGVPQARHLHVLLMRGRLILEQLFPGIVAELAAAGAPLADMTQDLLWLTPAGWGTRFRSELGVLACSRDLLEWHVRRRLKACPQVCFRTGCGVNGLVCDEQAKERITGVRLESRTSVAVEERGEELLRAELVVDASGRGSRAPQWLEALGYDAPQETVVNAFLGYASREYRRPAVWPHDWQGLYVQAAPPADLRGGVIFPIEGDRWLVTLVGMGGDYPPTDEAGFLAFAQSLRAPLLYETIKDAEPLTPVHSFRATENRLRHYERLSRQPENFIMLGDAACAFNPVYAQGMSAAAVGAHTLAECLRADDERGMNSRRRGFARRFQKQLARANSAAWLLATADDNRVPVTVGRRNTIGTRLLHRYLDEVVRLTTTEAEARRLLLEVFHLLKSPATIFRPGMLARVLRSRVRQRLRPRVWSHARRAQSA